MSANNNGGFLSACFKDGGCAGRFRTQPQLGAHMFAVLPNASQYIPAHLLTEEQKLSSPLFCIMDTCLIR